MKPAEPSASDLSSAARSGNDCPPLREAEGLVRRSGNREGGRQHAAGRRRSRLQAGRAVLASYLDLPEQPTDEELARLDPELAEALFGTPRRPFSVSLEFPDFDGPDFERALGLARASAELLEIGTPPRRRYRARFYSKDAPQLRDLFEIVGRFDGTDVLIDDRPVLYARELWLPALRGS